MSKLVRDNLGIEEKRITVLENDDAYEIALLDKVIEEALEVVNADNKDELVEELGDLYEVMHALVELKGISRKVQRSIIEKRGEKGGFEGRKYLVDDNVKNNS